MTLVRPLLSITALLLLAGCCAKEELQSKHLRSEVAEGAFILYSLDGDRYPGDPSSEGEEVLHGWVILKTCNIDTFEERMELLTALERGEEESRSASDGPSPDCFQPRHAIRTVRGGTTTDRLICFQCSNLMTWVDDVQIGGGSTSDGPRRFFDSVLSRCGGRD
ncbi:MAG: hypothetical protein GY895_03100 [Phycisphaera sp.]|nr:hypothetical protein [Phycisphaera sp.]